MVSNKPVDLEGPAAFHRREGLIQVAQFPGFTTGHVFARGRASILIEYRLQRRSRASENKSELKFL